MNRGPPITQGDQNVVRAVTTVHCVSRRHGSERLPPGLEAREQAWSAQWGKTPYEYHRVLELRVDGDQYEFTTGVAPPIGPTRLHGWRDTNIPTAAYAVLGELHYDFGIANLHNITRGIRVHVLGETIDDDLED